MTRFRLFTILLSVTSLVFLLGANEGGCGAGLDNRAGEPGIDVGGIHGAEWDMQYMDTMEVRIKNAGGVVATHNISIAAGGSFKLDGTPVDLGKLCERGDIACPDEVFPKRVTMRQPGNNQHLLYVTFNPEGPLKDIQEKTLIGNVDSDQDFSIALGVGGAAAGICGLLSVSYATGHIDADGDPPVGTTLKGDIVTAYSGGCLLAGSQGAAAAGLTVELRIPFSGKRL